MRKIENFESFAAGFFLGIGQKKPTAEDITKLSFENKSFSAALSFYMSTNIDVLAQRTTKGKYGQVAKNIRSLIEELP